MVIATGDANPTSHPAYSIPHSRKEAARTEIKAMLEADIIRPSKSPWAAPMLLVQKKDGALRPVVDYRRLNKVTQKDPYSIPKMDEIIDLLAGAAFITTLDMKQGYWQIPMHPDSIAKTAFVTPFGKYKFLVMPFGLMGAPATFQWLMNSLLGDLTCHTAAYMDDIVVFSATWEDHVCHLGETLTRIQSAGLTLKATKCFIAQKECLFLGHRVGGGKIEPGQAKFSAVENFRQPLTKKDIRAFLGLAGYYRKFVRDFAMVASPLTEMTKNVAPEKVCWSEVGLNAFRALKLALTSSPVLRGPDYSKPFILHTDASDVGLGAVLSQEWEQDADLPVAYFSRKLLPRERNYVTVDRECLVIVEGIAHFSHYLTGVWFTDHTCLRYLDSVRDDRGRRTRWTLRLQAYDFVVLHRAGSSNGNADGLSRQAWDKLAWKVGGYVASPSLMDRARGPEPEDSANEDPVPGTKGPRPEDEDPLPNNI